MRGSPNASRIQGRSSRSSTSLFFSTRSVSSQRLTAATPIREAYGPFADGRQHVLGSPACAGLRRALSARWPDPVQRVANLDALRAAAKAYEDRCAQEREAATVAGLLRYFDDLRSPPLQRDEILPSDDQHVPADEGAIVVCTYHKSKGLEWPVVVLANLDKGERRDAFDVTPESTGEGFDPERPLANRAIRYWPWPFGSTQKAPLADAAAQSSEGRLVSMREDKERARLLYVGFTRARDHLVLAARVAKGAAKTAWLDALSDEEGAPLVELPVTAEDGALAETRIRAVGDVLAVPTRVLWLGATRPEGREDAPSPVWFRRVGVGTGAAVSVSAGSARPPYRIAPSSGVMDWPELAAVVARSKVGAVERLPSAIVLDGRSYKDDILGNAVHAFLAADIEGLAAGERLARAKGLVEGWGLAGIVRAESLVKAGDALRAWVESKWPGATWRREIPIEGVVTTEHGERRVNGIIDLLLETETGLVLVDHKTYPNPSPAAWRAKCETFIPQLATYARVLNAVGGKKVAAVWVHLPVAGGVVEVWPMGTDLSARHKWVRRVEGKDVRRFGCHPACFNGAAVMPAERLGEPFDYLHVLVSKRHPKFRLGGSHT